MTEKSKARALHDLIAAVSHFCKEWADEADEKSLLEIKDAIDHHGGFFVTQIESAYSMPSRVSVALNIPSPDDPGKPNLIPLFVVEDVLPAIH